MKNLYEIQLTSSRFTHNTQENNDFLESILRETDNHIMVLAEFISNEKMSLLTDVKIKPSRMDGFVYFHMYSSLSHIETICEALRKKHGIEFEINEFV